MYRCVGMTSLRPDCHHDKLGPVLWPTCFAASIQTVVLRMGPQPLKDQPTLVWFYRSSSRVAPRHVVLSS